MPSQQATDFVVTRTQASRQAAGDPVMLVAAQRAMTNAPAVAAAGDMNANIRAVTNPQQLTTEDGLDGFNLRPGMPGYEAAVAVNSRNLRKLTTTGEIVEIEEPLMMVGDQAPRDRERFGAPEAQQQEATKTAAPTATAIAMDKRIIICYGPTPEKLVVVIEEISSGESLLSDKFDKASLRAVAPILAKLAPIKDMAGGWEKD